MKKHMRRIGVLLVAMALLAIGAAWYSAWSEYRRGVEHHRFIWGPESKAPAFNLGIAVNPAEMSLNTVSYYILAAAIGIPGLLCILLTWRPRNRKDQ